jgi:hypothetical protein
MSPTRNPKGNLSLKSLRLRINLIPILRERAKALTFGITAASVSQQRKST